MKKKLLIFGFTSSLGSNFIFFHQKKFEIHVVINKKKFFFSNIRYHYSNCFVTQDEKDLEKTISRVSPDVILNFSAETNIDTCEKKPKNTFFVNSILPEYLSRISKKKKIYFLHISTDHLFNDNKKFKDENHVTRAVNQYSKQKIIAEKEVLKNKHSCIIRTNFFAHTNKENVFINKVIKDLKSFKKVDLFSDYFFTPIYSKYLCLVITKFISKKINGVFNVSSNERLSKYEFISKIISKLKLNTLMINKVNFSKKNLSANRCKELSLSNKKLIKTIKIKIPTLDEQIGEFINNNRYLKNIDFKIPYGKHSIDNNDVRRVVSVLKSGSLTQGHNIESMEREVAHYVGAKYAVAVSSATAGLHLSYIALGVNYKKRIVTSPNTFVATSNAAIYCNSEPYFADICSKTLGLCPVKLEEKIKKKKDIKFIVPVHFGGLAANAKKIQKIAKSNRLKIIEDAAHALGAKYDCGSLVGSCKYSDVTIFSFHPVKILAGGEGGIITTNNKKIYDELLSLRSHGIQKNEKAIINKKIGFTNKKKNIWYYEMNRLGYHYRQTDIHSGLISSQLTKIDNFLIKRKKIAKYYDMQFIKNKFVKPLQMFNRDNSSNHLYVCDIDFQSLKITRNDFMLKLRDYNIITQVHYIPVPLQNFYKNKNFVLKDLKKTMMYYKNCVSLPIYYDLDKKMQKYVISSINEVLQSLSQKY